MVVRVRAAGMLSILVSVSVLIGGKLPQPKSILSFARSGFPAVFSADGSTDNDGPSTRLLLRRTILAYLQAQYGLK